MLVVRDREAGNTISAVRSIEEGQALIELYEADDRMNDCYYPDFYEVADVAFNCKNSNICKWICRTWIEDINGFTSEFDRFETSADANDFGEYHVNNIRRDEKSRFYEVYKED